MVRLNVQYATDRQGHMRRFSSDDRATLQAWGLQQARDARQHLDSVRIVGLDVRQRVIAAPVVGLSGADALSSGCKRRQQRSEVTYLAQRQR